MTPWTCFQYSKYLWKSTDTYLLCHRSRRRFPGNYLLIMPHWARTLCHRERLGHSTVSSGIRLCPEQATDLLPLMIPLRDDLLLLPLPVLLLPQSSPGHESPVELLASVDSACLDLSREGPFDAYCVPRSPVDFGWPSRLSLPHDFIPGGRCC